MQDNDTIFGFISSGLAPFMGMTDSQLNAGIAQATAAAAGSRGSEQEQHDQDAADMRGVLNLRRAKDYRRVTGRQAIR